MFRYGWGAVSSNSHGPPCVNGGGGETQVLTTSEQRRAPDAFQLRGELKTAGSARKRCGFLKGLKVPRAPVVCPGFPLPLALR